VVRFSRDTLLNVAAAPRVSQMFPLREKLFHVNYPTLKFAFGRGHHHRYPIQATSSTVKNSSLKIVSKKSVIDCWTLRRCGNDFTLCALLMRNLFATVKFIVVFILHFSFFIQFFLHFLYILCSVCWCTLTVYVC